MSDDPVISRPRLNALCDTPGLRVGHAADARLLTGVSVVVPHAPAVAAVDLRGGGPGSAETDALRLETTVEHVHAIVLSGGSAFGLEASSAVRAGLAARGAGFAVGAFRVPIVPQAVIFDLIDGAPARPEGTHAALARAALAQALAGEGGPCVGSYGAGIGARVAGMRGGLGQASALSPCGATVSAMVVVNALGAATIGDGPHFRAALWEEGAEFGGFGVGSGPDALRMKGAAPGESTTIAVVATDAALTPRQAKRFAVMAQDGLAMALRPVHTPLDGDCVFALSTALRPGPADHGALARLGALAATTLARAVARGVYAADPAPEGVAIPPSWRERFAR